MKRIGVLALQGAVAEHLDCLRQIDGVTAVPVRTWAEMESLDGMILPGGESTAMGKLLDYFQLLEPLQAKIQNGFPVWGTCAGMILLAKEISGQEKSYFAAMDIRVCRNGYGSQLDSFQAEIELPEITAEKIPLVFIRAPYIEAAGPQVQVLAEVDGRIVAAREAKMLVTSFHPELTADLSFHRYFAANFVR